MTRDDATTTDSRLRQLEREAQHDPEAAEALAAAQARAPEETTEERVRAALLRGCEPSVIADELGLDLDGEAVVMPGWWATDGEGPDVHYPDAEDGEEAAQDYYDGGDWSPEQETWWLDVLVCRVGIEAREVSVECPDCDGEGEIDGADCARCGGDTVVDQLVVDDVRVDRGHESVEVHPDEPACAGGEHDWEERDDARGHGGGVTYSERCTRCRCVRHHDTWAQDRTTGRQGLYSISYSLADDAAEQDDADEAEWDAEWDS